MKKELSYKWTLKDAEFTKDKGTVFSCFACGGGSTMGYKLAGFDVLGCNEIDPKMIEVYKENHNPKYAFLESITTFAKRKDLPKELYNLDILDGSPPCSSFSMAGNREKDWGKEKKFKEGQAKQVLDTLFFDFIDLAKELQPKIVVAENVSGLMKGKAKDYVIKVVEEFKKAGYELKVSPYLLNAADMGVPQKRERVFFIAIRKDLAGKFLEDIDMFQTAPKLDLIFKEKHILFKDIMTSEFDRPLKPGTAIHDTWLKRKEGDKDMSCTQDREFNKPNKFFSYNYIYPYNVLNTITAKDCNVTFRDARYLNVKENSLAGSYPLDYNFLKIKPHYLIGMSVPPLMTAKISEQIYKQWLSKL